MGDIVNKTKIAIRTVLVTVMLAVGCSSSEISARNNNSRISSVWNICTKKVPRIALLTAKGVVAGCSVYLALNYLNSAMPTCRRLVNCNFNSLGPVVLDLLKKGCTIAGLAFLAYKSGNSCLDDLARI